MLNPNKHLGDLGEILIAEMLKRQGRNVIMSSNPFDDEKDMLADGKKVEVKTQSKVLKYNAFSISSNQLYKLQNADEIYFVAAKPSAEWNGMWDYPEIGNVYFCSPDFKFTKWWNNQKILIPLDQPAMKFIYKVSDDVIEYMGKFTTKRKYANYY